MGEATNVCFSHLLGTSKIYNLKFGQPVLPIFPSPVAPFAYHTPAAASKGLLEMS